MARVNVKPQYKQIVKMFDSLTGSRSMYQVYTDCMEMCALSIQNSCEVYPARREEYENRYLNIISQYDDKERQVIVQIFAELTKMLEENPFQDLLGDLYMQLDMGSAAHGQFFTPYQVSRAMAQCVFNESLIKQKIAEKGYITVSEPCVGGGANIIAYLETLKNHGINYQECVIVVGQDLSRVAALMAYIVLSLLGCQAVIKIGDTLNNPYTTFFQEVHNSELFYTPMFSLNAGYTKNV